MFVHAQLLCRLARSALFNVFVKVRHKLGLFLSQKPDRRRHRIVGHTVSGSSSAAGNWPSNFNNGVIVRPCTNTEKATTPNVTSTICCRYSNDSGILNAKCQCQRPAKSAPEQNVLVLRIDLPTRLRERRRDRVDRHCPGNNDRDDRDPDRRQHRPEILIPLINTEQNEHDRVGDKGRKFPKSLDRIFTFARNKPERGRVADQQTRGHRRQHARHMKMLGQPE